MPKILIVDDEAPIRTLLEAAFQTAGFEVRTAPSGERAVEICRSEQFDVLLTDVVMPGMNGHELARWIATNQPNAKTALMSGCDVNCEGCAYSSRCTLLAKPFRMAQAISLIEELLARPEPNPFSDPI